MLQLNYVRDELTAALLEIAQTGRNQIVTMAERAGSSNRYTGRPKREIAFGGDVSVVVDAEPVRCAAGKRFKTSSLPVSPAIFRQVSWRLAMHRMPAASQAWLNYCYGDSLAFEAQKTLVTYVWEQLGTEIKKSGLPKMSSKTSSAVKALMWLAVQESKFFLSRGIFRYTPEELSRLCGVSWDNWRKHYQRRWDLMLESISQLDNEALIDVEKHRKSACCNRR